MTFPGHGGGFAAGSCIISGLVHREGPLLVREINFHLQRAGRFLLAQDEDFPLVQEEQLLLCKSTIFSFWGTNTPPPPPPPQGLDGKTNYQKTSCDLDQKDLVLHLGSGGEGRVGMPNHVSVHKWGHSQRSRASCHGQIAQNPKAMLGELFLDLKINWKQNTG